RAAIVDRVAHPPGLATVGGTLKMHPPTIVLGAAGAEDGAIGKFKRFVLYRADQRLAVHFPQFLLFAPGAAAVVGNAPFAPPLPWVGAHLEEQHWRSLGRLEQHRVPAWIPQLGRLDAVGHH